jgi:hypothetical protein
MIPFRPPRNPRKAIQRGCASSPSQPTVQKATIGGVCIAPPTCAQGRVIVVQVIETHRPLVCAQQPTFEQRDDAVDTG